jgi:hypothetical protein
MIQSGHNPSLGQIGFGILGFLQTMAMRHLDGDISCELLVVCQVDPAEAAIGQNAANAITPDPLGLTIA